MFLREKRNSGMSRGKRWLVHERVVYCGIEERQACLGKDDFSERRQDKHVQEERMVCPGGKDDFSLIEKGDRKGK